MTASFRRRSRAFGIACTLASTLLAGAPAAVVADDSRTRVPVDPQTRASVLTEMRDFLQAIRTVVHESLAGNAKAVASAAHEVGLSHFAQSNGDPARAVYKVGGGAPEQFRQLAAQVHAGFDRIGSLAEQGADLRQILTALDENLARCVACHAAYRFPSIEPERQTTLPRTVLNPPHAR